MLSDDPALHIHIFGAPATVAGQPVVGIHHNPAADDMGLQGSAPSLQVVTAEIPADAGYGAAVSVAGYNYTIGKRHDDGTGATVLTLREA